MREDLDAPVLPMMTRALGIAGVALLALTACGGEGEDPQEGDPGQEDVDPDGADDQGDEPDEIAEDDDEDGTSDEDGDDSDGEDAAEADDEDDEPDEGDEDAGADEAPELSEIEAELWETMENAESVVLEAEMPFSPDDFEGEVDVGEAETLHQFYSGQVDGSALTFLERAGDAEQEYITFDDATFLRGEDELRAISEQFPGDVDEEELAEELEGRWVDYTEIFPEGFAVSDWLAEFREGLDSAGGFGELDAATETRDGEDVWVYTDDEREIVVRPGDEPVLVSVEADVEGEVTDVRFSEWNEADEPERPAEEDILTVQDLEELLT